MSVGQELLDVPLPDMVARLGMGIAEAQAALDRNSIETLRELNAEESKVDVVTSVTKFVREVDANGTGGEPDGFNWSTQKGEVPEWLKQVDVEGSEGKKENRPIMVPEVVYATNTTKMSPLQLGLMPTFYQFSEATIDVSMDITTKSESETGGSVSASAGGRFGLWGASVKTEAKHNRKFGKTVEGSSRLTTTLVPVPPPERLQPEYETIDLRGKDDGGKDENEPKTDE
ncbi:hypothetical protein [Salinigranum sp.]|uniref:hypothetical protein n=1 Tax=Salinigranum sp. TaxID=1966351 RepID=UPI00356A2966